MAGENTNDQKNAEPDAPVSRMMTLLRGGKKHLSVGKGDSSCAKARADCRRTETEEDSWEHWLVPVCIFVLVVFVIACIANYFHLAWAVNLAAAVLIVASIISPLLAGEKDHWPGYLFAMKVVVFIVISVLLFLAASGQDSAMSQSSGCFALAYAALFSLPLLLMMYIARKDDPSTRENRKCGENRFATWLGWRNAKAARIGARFAIYPLLLDLIFLLELVPPVDSLVAKLAEKMMNAYFSLSTVAYAVKLWETWMDEIEKEKKKKKKKREKIKSKKILGLM